MPPKGYRKPDALDRDPEHRKRRNREYYLRRRQDPDYLLTMALHRYKMTAEEYRELLDAQGGVCAICGESCKTGHRLSVDHDHETGAIRGLLCRKCNSGIGYFQDSLELLKEAVNYLEVS